jgi:uncharacterized membrane protein
MEGLIALAILAALAIPVVAIVALVIAVGSRDQSPAFAFVLLGIVVLLTLGALLLHGPALAGLGLVGAFVTPLLVSTGVPNYWALYIYLAVVTGAAFALARMRMWRWLAVTAIVLGTLWIFPGIADPTVDAITPHAFHAAAGFGLVAALIVAGLLWGPPALPGRIDDVSSGALAAYLFAAAMVVIANRHDGLTLIVLLGFLELRHLMNDGDVYRTGSDLSELAL